MADMEPVTEREWKMALDAHNREHTLEERNRDNLAHILEAYRQEAREANNLRLEGMNEFRDQLRSQASTFVTLDKYDTQSRAGAQAIEAIGTEVNRRLLIIENKLANTDGKMAAFAFIATLVPTAIAIAAYLK